jgi:hypothetical protein
MLTRDKVGLRGITAFRADTDELLNTAATSAVVPGPFFLPARACPESYNDFVYQSGA